MKLKSLLIILIVFLFCGCTSKNEFYVETLIRNENNLKVSIFYPKTGYSTLDKKIDSYIKSSYSYDDEKIFLDTLDEINIDYTYFQNDSIISIVLFKTDNNFLEITTYNYDFKNDKFIDFDYFIKDESIILKYLKEQFKIDENINLDDIKTNNFSIDHEYIYFYYPKDTFKNNQDSLIVKIPLKNTSLKTSKVVNTLQSRNIDASKKVVALTFDDGPSRYTKDILKILKDNDAVATFFILGNKVKIYKDVLEECINGGNEIGNHTFNHKWLTKLKDDEIKEQISDTQNIIEETLGYTPKLFRPSYGSLNKRVRKDVNLDIVLWNVDTMDWKYKSTSKIVARATNNVKDLDIILFHDTYKSTKDSLEKVILTLKEKGFTFVTVSELKEIKRLRDER